MALNRKVFKVPKNDKEDVPIAIVDTPCRAEGLSLTTWSSAGILSNLLHKLDINQQQLQQDNDRFTILELGAGTGLSGLTAACVWGTGALLTDLPTIVPGVQANVDLNTDTLKAHGASAACGTLDWKQADTIHLYADGEVDGEKGSFTVDDVNGFPIILAADTMYTEEHPQLLSQAILRCLRRSKDAKAIVVYAMRVAYIDYMREFWELMEAGGLVAAQEGREEIDLREWDDEKLHEWSVWKWKDL
ncbi:hypothetical protein N0V93_004445 [Gnomoniopsis smithogilvyi]|uniref:Uncharacterized protein n=1 Tax=Gnomoniopsis smithogilvyi TaxID=1191159 RepID=A0A9W9CX74_9PEZI|nr:hypothetical protein N0V93_004445 [Gnomoniopsis smithogilvyi]